MKIALNKLIVQIRKINLKMKNVMKKSVKTLKIFVKKKIGVMKIIMDIKKRKLIVGDMIQINVKKMIFVVQKRKIVVIQKKNIVIIIRNLRNVGLIQKNVVKNMILIVNNIRRKL